MRVYEIAQLLDGELYGDGNHEICNVADLENASSSELAFAEGERALQQAAASQAGCILVPEGVSLHGHTVIRVKHPKLAFIEAANALRPSKLATPGIHPTAVISPTASLPSSASIGPYVTIEDHATMGERCVLAAGVFIGAGVEIGSDCTLYPGVRVYPDAQIGSHVTLHAGVVIGGDGFGYVFAEGRHHKFPQLGKVIIEDDVEIGCNTTVDRGSLGTTVIGSGTKIDNLVQIAHNVRIGRHCIIAAQTGISGSTEIGDYVIIGGQVGIGDHVRIEDGAVIGSQAGILPGKVIRKGSVLWGTPARPLREFKKLYAYFSHLPDLAQKVKELSRRTSKG
jgi:UDP-3-O-[3-hydroxymyristoyl] glucosamine N-acyltransferase